MTKRKPTTTEGRLNALETELRPKDKPTIVIYPSLDNPDLYYTKGKPGDIYSWLDAPDYETYINGKPEDLVPKQELIERLEKDYIVIVVTYVKDWKGLHE